MISRDWHCLNERCGHAFHSFDPANPPCPQCGCVRVSWIPGGGHIGKMAKSVDKSLRAIADQHGLTNLNSPSHSRLNRAMPRLEVPPISPEMGIRNFAPGFSAPVSAHGPICVPSTAPIDLRGKVQIGVARDSSKSIPGPMTNTVIEGRHRVPTGKK